jgi:hypothetical protein
VRRRAARRGSLLALVTFIAFLLASALSTLWHLTRADFGGNALSVRELEANAVAESIATQIDARAVRRPWEQRFWMLEAQLAGKAAPFEVRFEKGSKHVDLSKDKLRETSFAGMVRDTDPLQKEYRVTLDLEYHGERFRYAWDRRLGDAIPRFMTRVPRVLARRLEGRDPFDEATQTWLDGLRGDAMALSATDRALRDRWRVDHKAWNEFVYIPAQYGLPYPGGGMYPPPAPAPTTQASNPVDTTPTAEPPAPTPEPRTPIPTPTIAEEPPTKTPTPTPTPTMVVRKVPPEGGPPEGTVVARPPQLPPALDPTLVIYNVRLRGGRTHMAVQHIMLDPVTGAEVNPTGKYYWRRVLKDGTVVIRDQDGTVISVESPK